MLSTLKLLTSAIKKSFWKDLVVPFYNHMLIQMMGFLVMTEIAICDRRAELDAISLIKDDCPSEKEDSTSLSSQKEENLLSFGDALQCSKNDQSLLCEFFKVIEAKKIGVNVQESISLETANSLLSTLTSQLASFNSITCQTNSWEEMSMAVKLANKIQKSKRNKRRKRKKRKLVAEKLQQVGLSHVTVLFGLHLRYSYGCYPH